MNQQINKSANCDSSYPVTAPPPDRFSLTTHLTATTEEQKPSVAPSFISTLSAFAERSKGVLALCDQGMVSLTNFLTGLVIGRVAEKTELGLYALGLTLTMMAAQLSQALITTPYTVFAPTMGKTERNRYLGSMLVQQVVLAVLIALLMFLTILALPHTASRGVGPTVNVAASMLVFISLREFVRRICFADLNIGAAVALDIGACLAQTAGITVLWRTGRLTASATYLLLGAISMLVALAWIALNRTHLSMDYRHWLPGLKHNWEFAKWLLASGLVWAVAMYLYPWFLTVFHGAGVTGIWAASSGLVALLNPVLLGRWNYIGPKIAHIYASNGKRALSHYVYRDSMIEVALLLPLAALLFIGGGRILTTMYGAAYTGNGLVIALLALNLLLSAFNYPYTRGLFALNAARMDTIINLAAFAILFTVGIAAANVHGVLGAAAALLLSAVTTTAMRVVAFVRASRVSFSAHI